MRSEELDLQQYASDKISNEYLRHYDSMLEPWVDEKLTLLELGILKGGSLLLWRDYFPLATVVGIDTKPTESFQPGERIHVFKGSQADPHFLSQVANDIAPEGFDIIIDDASHIGVYTKIAFWHLFEHHLKPGGLYVIEDWGCGYWSDFNDGRSLDLDSYRLSASKPRILLGKILRKLRIKVPLRSHSYGITGFIKQLVDEQAASNATMRKIRGTSERQSRFESMLIKPGLVFIKKASDQPAGSGEEEKRCPTGKIASLRFSIVRLTIQPRDESKITENRTLMATGHTWRESSQAREVVARRSTPELLPRPS